MSDVCGWGHHPGLGGVEYSVSAERSRKFGADLVVPSSEAFAGGTREPPVVGPLSEAEGLALRREYGQTPPRARAANWTHPEGRHRVVGPGVVT